jgi:hypothetical protein
LIFLPCQWHHKLEKLQLQFKKNYSSSKKNYSSSVKRREDGILCMSCDEEHDFNDNNPVVVFITDQNFPPSLPSHEHRCVVVLRLEDCLLSEQPGILKEFFGTRSRYLPEGSMLSLPKSREQFWKIVRRECVNFSAGIDSK